MKKNIAISSVVLGLTALVAAIPVFFAHADDYGGYDSSGSSSYDYGGYDSGSSYNYGGYDTSSSPSYSDYGGYDYSSSPSYSDYGGYDSSGSYNYGGYDTSSSPSYSDYGGYDYASNFSPDTTSGYTNFSPDCGSDCYTNFSADTSTGYTNFSPDCASCTTYTNFSPDCSSCTTEGGVTYSTEGGSGTSYSTEYGSGTDYGCGCSSRPFVIPTPTSYPIPPSYYPIPQPIPQPYPVPTPIPQPVPQPIIVPQQPSVITNNTCTNGSCNYTNNSVNNSGNTVTVLPIAQAPISYPVVYTPPIQNVSCTISAAPNQVSAGQYTFLQWQSTGAISATLSGYGNVAPSGSLSIRPTGSQNYILTVYGQNGQSATCNTFVTIGQIAQYPSVTLSQIPYTGFDFGPVGDAMYWALLALFALASGYLLIYYKGGMTAFAHFAPRRAPMASAPAAKVAAAPAVTAKVEAVAKPAAAPSLPTFAAGTRPTSDSMKVSATADGTPRIVISRN